MRLSTRCLVALSIVGVLALSGCGDDDTQPSGDNAGGSSTATASESTTSDDAGEETGEDDTEDDTEDDGAIEVEIEIEDGTSSPAGERITVDPGQTVRLEVDSDMVDELHLHADPEQSFQVEAADDQEFEFAIDTPGVYELESHETGNQVISIQVQP